MLTNASAVHGYAIVASDGRIGSISDFLFDDASWSVRWLVVETGKQMLMTRGSLTSVVRN